MDEFICECGKPKLPRQEACMDCMFAVAAVAYDPERHDPDSVFFDDSYVGPSELELGGGCNRCGSPDDCYCNG
jgi:hypothetical protein